MIIVYLRTEKGTVASRPFDGFNDPEYKSYIDGVIRALSFVGYEIKYPMAGSNLDGMHGAPHTITANKRNDFICIESEKYNI